MKGRNPAAGRFTRITHKLMESAAYRALSPNARSLLLELAMMENGRNNGTGLFLSVRDAADRMGVADPNTAGAAFEELEKLGFIVCTSPAHFAVKAGSGSRARYWRLTWEAVAGAMGPTHEYEKLEPEPGTRDRKRMIAGQKALKRWKREQDENRIAVQDFHTLKPERVGKKHTTPAGNGGDIEGSVRDFPTRFSGNGEKPPIVVVGDIPTYTADQYGADAEPPEKLEGVDPPALANGPSSAESHPLLLDIVRAQVAAHCQHLDQLGRARLAQRVGLTTDELRLFEGGRLVLAVPKLMALRSATRSIAA
jgi:hypothetical protein